MTIDIAPDVDASQQTGAYVYRRRELLEPDWRRIPAWRQVTNAEWEDIRWQRSNCVRSADELRGVFGSTLDESFYADVARDIAERATMALLLPPQVLNCMVPDEEPTTKAMYVDPLRRYMLPVFSDRDPIQPSHPVAQRDSLHEADMWVAEGLTHRYPTKVLAEVVHTCPQYCGHCTRMDLVGGNTPQVHKLRFRAKAERRYDDMLEYLHATPTVRDVVVSGGDVANIPWPRLEAFLHRLMDVPSIRDVRLASKAVVDLPQLWLQDEVRAGVERLVGHGRRTGTQLAVHTHVNTAQSVTPLAARTTRALLDAGVRDVRNQGVLLRGVNTTREALLDLCFALLDEAWVTPYYFYMCDIIPNVEHWRIPLRQAQQLQHDLLGYLPGFATPRVVCDVPWVGKRWVHQARCYDRDRGISWWSKAYSTPFEAAADGNQDEYRYYDPISALPPAGQAWWREQRWHRARRQTEKEDDHERRTGRHGPRARGAADARRRVGG